MRMRECRLCGADFVRRGRETLCLACETTRWVIAGFLGISKRWAERYVVAGLESESPVDPSWVEFRHQVIEAMLVDEAERRFTIRSRAGPHLRAF